MIFDQTRELPTARVHQDAPSIAESIGVWFAARWQWFRPRMIPVAVAALGMVGMLRAVDYLSTANERSAIVGKAYSDPVRVVLAR